MKNEEITSLEALRTYTRMTGVITDQQVKTLNAFPIVMLDGTLSHETRINLEDQEVEYVLKFPRGKIDQDRSHYERLEIGVQALLGAGWKLKCTSKKKLIFEGSRAKELYPAVDVKFEDGLKSDVYIKTFGGSGKKTNE